jgi:hypothetical protein
MKALSIACLSVALLAFGFSAHAEDWGGENRPKPLIELGTDADYNLDFNGHNGSTCQVNALLGLSPDQKKRLRNSRLELQHNLMKAGVDPAQDPNMPGRKVKAIRPILSEYQFHKYLSMREYCNE